MQDHHRSHAVRRRYRNTADRRIRVYGAVTIGWRGDIPCSGRHALFDPLTADESWLMGSGDVAKHPRVQAAIALCQTCSFVAPCAERQKGATPRTRGSGVWAGKYFNPR